MNTEITLSTGRKVWWNASVDKSEITGLGQWIQELKSGKHKQSRGILTVGQGRGYCCLGLKMTLEGATEVKGCGDGCQFNLIPKGSNVEYGEKYSGNSGLGSCGDLPAIVYWIDPGDTECSDTTLAQLNDRGWSFAEIAELLPHLFTEKGEE